VSMSLYVGNGYSLAGWSVRLRLPFHGHILSFASARRPPFHWK
jgi:hypothetical protein